MSGHWSAYSDYNGFAKQISKYYFTVLICLIKVFTKTDGYTTHCVECVTDLQAVSRGPEGGNSSDSVV